MKTCKDFNITPPCPFCLKGVPGFCNIVWYKSKIDNTPGGIKKFIMKYHPTSYYFTSLLKECYPEVIDFYNTVLSLK
jgi:hypothetical protein